MPAAQFSESHMTNKVYLGDAVELLQRVPDNAVNLVFADPPYNIGFDYGQDGYEDNRTAGEYVAWCEVWLRELFRVLKPDGSFWLAIGDEFAAELKLLANSAGFHMRSWVIWYYTFGVNSSRKFTRSHTHLLYFVKDEKNFTFNTQEVRVPSARQIVYNDKRASPKGRLPDDTWILRPQDIPESFGSEEDVWSIARVCGTFSERQEGAANQMPEQLLGRIIRVSSNPGELVFDPMAGTGTTLATAKKLSRRYLGFELVERFANLSSERARKATEGDALDGPLPQGS